MKILEWPRVSNSGPRNQQAPPTARHGHPTPQALVDRYTCPCGWLPSPLRRVHDSPLDVLTAVSDAAHFLARHREYKAH